MCGIVGYVGNRDCADVLVDGLSKLEYRGYDSAGIAVFEREKIVVEKSKGKLNDLVEKMQQGKKPHGHCGIGHTRWATHGEPSDINSHPHGNKRVTIVHNGIIENYKQIKEFLISQGYGFESETDTETVAKLLDYYYDGDPVQTIAHMIDEVQGSYALGIMFRDFPDRIYAVRKDSPLIIGVGENENFIASDVPAILKYTRDYYLLEQNEIAAITADGVVICDNHNRLVEKEVLTADWDIDAAEKGGYEHFMLKEIYEQPGAVRDTFSPRLKNGEIVIEELGMTDEELRAVKKLCIVACGSAYHTGMTCKYVFEGLARIPVEVELASEFRYRNPILEEGTLVVLADFRGYP